MTALIRLDEIQARVDAATEPIDSARWWIDQGVGWEIYSSEFPTEGSEDIASRVYHKADAEFIAYSRQDVPDLTAALRAALDQCERVQADLSADNPFNTSGLEVAAAVVRVITEKLGEK